MANLLFLLSSFLGTQLLMWETTITSIHLSRLTSHLMEGTLLHTDQQEDSAMESWLQTSPVKLFQDLTLCSFSTSSFLSLMMSLWHWCTAEFLGFTTYPPAYLSQEAQGNRLLRGVNFASGASGLSDTTAQFYVRKRIQISHWYHARF